MITYFLDRFLGLEVRLLKMNTGNDLSDYQKINSDLEKFLLKTPKRTREKPSSRVTPNGSKVMTPGSKPIDKQDYLNGVQQEIHVPIPNIH